MFLKSVTQSVFIKATGFYQNGNEGVSDRVCFLLLAVVESAFSKALGPY